MPHPKFADATIDLDLLPRAQQILEEMNALSNVYIDRSDDYRNSLTNADAIIVDRSAVMIEVGALGVPVLYMYNKTYNEPMTEPIQKLLDNYYQGTTEQEMEGFCDMIRAGEDEKREFRQNAFRVCLIMMENVRNAYWKGYGWTHSMMSPSEWFVNCLPMRGLR